MRNIIFNTITSVSRVECHAMNKLFYRKTISNFPIPSDKFLEEAKNFTLFSFSCHKSVSVKKH